MKQKLLSLAALLFLGALSQITAQAAPSLVAGKPIPLLGTSGRFDFIRMDPSAERLLLGHSGNHSFDIFDIKSGKLLKSFTGYDAADAGSDAGCGFYYASCSDPARLLIVDSSKMEVAGEVPLPANSDLMGVNPTTGMVHVCDDTAPNRWVVDPSTKKIAHTIQFEGSGLEDVAFSADGKLVYQAIKGTGSIAVYDIETQKVTATWPTGVKGPWGMAMVPDQNMLLAACAGKLLMVDCATGKVVASAPIAGRVDEMAYDPALHRAYCSSRTGKISVVSVESAKLISLEDVSSHEGCGNIAVDPGTHTVWIAYGTGEASFLQPFYPGQENPPTRSQ